MNAESALIHPWKSCSDALLSHGLRLNSTAAGSKAALTAHSERHYQRYRSGNLRNCNDCSVRSCFSGRTWEIRLFPQILRPFFLEVTPVADPGWHTLRQNLPPPPARKKTSGRLSFPVVWIRSAAQLPLRNQNINALCNAGSFLENRADLRPAFRVPRTRIRPRSHCRTGQRGDRRRHRSDPAAAGPPDGPHRTPASAHCTPRRR